MIATAGRCSASSRASRSMRAAVTPVICSTACGRVVGEAAAPSRRSSAPARPAASAGRSLLAQDHVREAEREHAFGARPDRHPLVGARAGLRHARLDLDERAAHARPALPHVAVRRALRDRRVPGAEEIGAERDHDSARRARSNVGSCSRPKLIAFARRSTSSPNSSNVDRRRRAEPREEQRRSGRGARSTPGRVKHASDV